MIYLYSGFLICCRDLQALELVVRMLFATEVSTSSLFILSKERRAVRYLALLQLLWELRKRFFMLMRGIVVLSLNPKHLSSLCPVTFCFSVFFFLSFFFFGGGGGGGGLGFFLSSVGWCSNMWTVHMNQEVLVNQNFLQTTCWVLQHNCEGDGSSYNCILFFFSVLNLFLKYEVHYEISLSLVSRWKHWVTF